MNTNHLKSTVPRIGTLRQHYRTAIAMLVVCFSLVLPAFLFAQGEVTFELVGQFGGWMRAVALDETGNYALLAQGSGIVVLDVTNPNQIQPVTFRQGKSVGK